MEFIFLYRPLSAHSTKDTSWLVWLAATKPGYTQHLLRRGDLKRRQQGHNILAGKERPDDTGGVSAKRAGEGLALEGEGNCKAARGGKLMILKVVSCFFGCTM
jgi:hypothetical protein